MNKYFLFIRKPLLFFIVSIVAYLLLAVIGTLIPSKDHAQNESDEAVPIFVISNGFHTDIVLPLEQALFDRLEHVSPSIREKYKGYKYISVGWGDRGFYMESFDNQFPTILTTLKAVFLPTSSLTHLSFYQYDLRESEDTVKLLISKKQLEKLRGFIEETFLYSEEGKWISYHEGYGYNDYFFLAKGSYHLFNTCNVWTNEALKAADLPSSLWSPFAQGVMWRIVR